MWGALARPATAAATVLRTFQRNIGKYTKHGNFTSKRGNKSFNKGRGGLKYGVTGNRGGFVHRMGPNYHMPDMTGFALKPYVAFGEGFYREKYRAALHTPPADEAAPQA